MVASLTRRSLRLALVLGPLVGAALSVTVPPAAATVVKVQQGSEATASSGSVAPTLSSASTSGTLLVAVLANRHTTSAAFSAPSGWVRAVTKFDACCGTVDVWYYPNNPGGISSATFTAGSGTDTIIGQLSEWNGIVASSPVDQTGTLANTTGSSVTVSTSANLTVSGDVGITGFLAQGTGLTSFTAGSGWAHLFSDTTRGSVSDSKTGLASGAVASETEGSSPSTTWIGVIAAFKASTCSGGALGLTAPASTSFPSLTLNGTDQTATATATLKPDDETSGHAGWNITGTSTTFSTGAPVHSLSTTATSTTAASTATTGGNCVMPTNSIAYPVTLPAGSSPPTAVKLYNAASATGQGPTNVTLSFRLSAPANTFHGTYTSTWTFAIVSGP